MKHSPCIPPHAGHIGPSSDIGKSCGNFFISVCSDSPQPKDLRKILEVTGCSSRVLADEERLPGFLHPAGYVSSGNTGILHKHSVGIFGDPARLHRVRIHVRNRDRHTSQDRLSLQLLLFQPVLSPNCNLVAQIIYHFCSFHQNPVYSFKKGEIQLFRDS